MKPLIFSTLVIFLLFSTFISQCKSEKFEAKNLKDVNGGVNCAACSIVVTLVEQLAIVYNDTIEESLNKLCNFVPEGIFRITCQQAVETFGPVVIDG